MKIATRRGHLVALESVAMTDIVLNMFIFFFISFSLLYTFNSDRTQSIKVELPTAGSAVKTKETAPLIITVTRNGLAYLGEKAMSDEELKAEISRRCKENSKLDISLRSDRQTQFQDVVRILSIISERRIGNLDIEVIKEKTDGRKAAISSLDHIPTAAGMTNTPPAPRLRRLPAGRQGQANPKSQSKQ